MWCGWLHEVVRRHERFGADNIMILYMAIDKYDVLSALLAIAFFAVGIYFIGQKIHVSMRREGFENPGDKPALIFIGIWLSLIGAIIILAVIKLSFEKYPRFPELRRYR